MLEPRAEPTWTIGPSRPADPPGPEPVQEVGERGRRQDPQAPPGVPHRNERHGERNPKRRKDIRRPEERPCLPGVSRVSRLHFLAQTAL